MRLAGKVRSLSSILLLSRRLTAVLLVALLILLAIPVGVHAAPLRLPPHERVVLKNGLTVLLLEKHGVPFVSFAAVVRSGATADPAGQAGLASVTASLLRKGTKTRTAQQFAADLDFIGGSFHAGAGSDLTTVSAEFLNKDLARGLDLLSDALLHPSFPQQEIEKLIRQNVDGIKAAKDEAQSVLTAYFDGYLYGTHPYGRPAEGDEVSLGRIHRDAIAKFYEANYTPGNTILAVAGDFSAPEMKKKLEQAFGAWTGRSEAPPAVATLPAAKGKRLLLINKPDSTQTFFALGNVGVSRTDPDRVAIRVVNTIFGGRFTSMLNDELRIRSGLTYGAVSFFDSRKTPGPFVMFSYTRNETTGQAIDLALAVLGKLHKDGLTKEQLDSAKSYIKGQFPPTIETSMQLARLLATNESYGLDDSEVNELEPQIDAVTLDAARRVIEKHFPLDHLVFVLIGKASEIKPAVQKYATQMDTTEISAPGFWPPASAAGKPQ